MTLHCTYPWFVSFTGWVSTVYFCIDRSIWSITLLTIVNKAAVNTLIQIFLGTEVFISLGQITWTEIAGSRGATWWETVELFLSGCAISPPHQRCVEVPVLVHASWQAWCYRSWEFQPFRWVWRGISLCFNFQFPNDLRNWTSFHVLIHYLFSSTCVPFAHFH